MSDIIYNKNMTLAMKDAITDVINGKMYGNVVMPPNLSNVEIGRIFDFDEKSIRRFKKN